jgi:hypothetical protein
VSDHETTEKDDINEVSGGKSTAVNSVEDAGEELDESGVPLRSLAAPVEKKKFSLQAVSKIVTPSAASKPSKSVSKGFSVPSAGTSKSSINGDKPKTVPSTSKKPSSTAGKKKRPHESSDESGNKKVSKKAAAASFPHAPKGPKNGYMFFSDTMRSGKYPRLLFFQHLA